MNQLALAYALSETNIDHIIVGVDNKDQLRQNILNAQSVLKPDIKQKIDKICVEEIEVLYPKNWK